MSNAEKTQFDIDYDKCQEILSQNGDDKHRGNSDIVSAMMEYARLKSQEVNRELVEALRSHVRSWEVLKGNRNYNAKDIERWLMNDMKPSIDNIRKLIAKHTPKG